MAVRGDRQDRGGQRSPHLRRLLQCALEGLGRHAVEARHHTAAAVRLYDRQECVRHHPGDRRHGPASQRSVRWILPGVIGQRFYPASRPHPRAGRRCVSALASRRPRRASVRPAADLSTPRTCFPARRTVRMPPQGATASAPDAATPIIKKVIAQMESEDGWVGSGRSEKGSPTWPPISIPGPIGFRKLSDLVRKTNAFEIDHPKAGGTMRIRIKPAAGPPPKARAARKPSGMNAPALPFNAVRLSSRA